MRLQSRIWQVSDVVCLRVCRHENTSGIISTVLVIVGFLCCSYAACVLSFHSSTRILYPLPNQIVNSTSFGNSINSPSKLHHASPFAVWCDRRHQTGWAPPGQKHQEHIGQLQMRRNSRLLCTMPSNSSILLDLVPCWRYRRSRQANNQQHYSSGRRPKEVDEEAQPQWVWSAARCFC